jgi:hypothetical protein
MDKVSHIIGVAKVEFDGELVSYEATPKGHRVCILFNSITTYNEYWKVADHVQKCYCDDLIVEHFIPYSDDHDPVKRTATRLYAQLQRM